jgi:hypothetical protein
MKAGFFARASIGLLKVAGSIRASGLFFTAATANACYDLGLSENLDSGCDRSRSQLIIPVVKQ